MSVGASTTNVTVAHKHWRSPILRITYLHTNAGGVRKQLVFIFSLIEGIMRGMRRRRWRRWHNLGRSNWNNKVRGNDKTFFHPTSPDCEFPFYAKTHSSPFPLPNRLRRWITARDGAAKTATLLSTPAAQRRYKQKPRFIHLPPPRRGVKLAPVASIISHGRHA